MGIAWYTLHDTVKQFERRLSEALRGVNCGKKKIPYKSIVIKYLMTCGMSDPTIVALLAHKLRNYSYSLGQVGMLHNSNLVSGSVV